MLTRHAKEVIKHLERVAGRGYSASRVFSDFCQMTLHSLEQLPAQFKAAATTGRLAEDPPDVQEFFRRMEASYPNGQMSFFHQAFAALLDSTEDWADTMGDVFMEFGNPNPRSGQFFTPWNVAECMADMMIGIDVNKVLKERLTEAHQKLEAEDPALGAYASALLMTSFLDPERAMHQLIPILHPYFQPISVVDPACGSGVMLLAAAKMFPRWAVHYGLVQFWGMDIDQNCVMMARINCMLYGLNGYSLRCALEVSQIDLQKYAAPLADQYIEAQVAHKNGDQAKVRAISEAIFAERSKPVESPAPADPVRKAKLSLF